MCLSPVTMPTNSKYVNLATIGTRLYSTYNCGQCADCLRFKHFEYYLRSSAEYKETERLGGFTYWETLTYAPENIPVLVPETSETDIDGVTVTETSYVIKRGEHLHKSDGTTLKVFNRDDYRHFLRILRQKLRRSGYDPKESLRYFLVTEYGDPKKTFRPHYHVIFFVTIPELTPALFQKFIKQSWTYGITDIETPLEPVFDVKTGKYKGHIVNGLGVTNYIAKYVNKPFQYTKLLENFRKTNGLSHSEYLLVKPFHVQSQGFGFGLVNNTPLSDIIETGKCMFEDSKGKQYVTLPIYYIRKLFYTCVKFADGTRHWQLNDNGKKWMDNQENKILTRSATRMEDIYNNIPQLNEYFKQEYEKYLDNAFMPFRSTDYQKLITQLLDGRTFMDLAIYQRYYKGRAYCKVMPTVTLVYNQAKQPLLDYSTFDSDELNDVHIKVLSNPFTIYRYDDKKQTFENLVRYDPITDTVCVDKQNRNDFCKDNCINQDSAKRFRNFDDIIQLFTVYTQFQSDNSTTAYKTKCRAEESCRLIKQKFNL